MARPVENGTAASIQGRVIAETRRRILNGELGTGVNLSELALAEEFGVSRTRSVRPSSSCRLKDWWRSGLGSGRLSQRLAP